MRTVVGRAVHVLPVLLALGACAFACSESVDGQNAPGGGDAGRGGASSRDGGAAHDGGQPDAGAPADGGGDGGISDGVWEPIAPLAECDAESLRLPSDGWPPRSWAPCGTGCQASAAARTDEFGRYIASSARYEGGELYMRTYAHGRLAGVGTRSFQELARVRDGEPLAVVRHDTGCASSAIKEDVVFLLEVLAVSGGAQPSHWAMLFDRATGSTVSTPDLFTTTPAVPAWFAWSGGGGLIDGGNLRVALHPGVGTLTTVTATPSTLSGARARGDLTVWIDWGTKPSKLQSFTPIGGVRTLVHGQNDVAAVALGDERIAWVGATGVDAIGGIYDTARLYWSPMTKNPAEVVVHEGPDLSGLLQGVVDIATAGDVIAVGARQAPKGDAGLYVYRISTGKLAFVPNRPTHRLVLAAVSPDEAVLMECPRVGSPVGFERWLRFDLARLDDLPQGWQ